MLIITFFNCPVRGVVLSRQWSCPVPSVELSCPVSGVVLSRQWSCPVPSVELSCPVSGVVLSHQWSCPVPSVELSCPIGLVVSDMKYVGGMVKYPPQNHITSLPLNMCTFLIGRLMVFVVDHWYTLISSQFT